MSNLDLLRSATEAEIGREIIRLVPHWYEAELRPRAVLDSRRLAHGPLLQPLQAHARRCKTLLAQDLARTRTLPLEHFVDLPSLIDVLLESFAIEWLRMHSGMTDWARLIKYLETVARRTYENQPVALNLIIREGQGTGDITDPHLQKFFDRLASSSFSYLAVDSELRLIEYGEVEWAQVDDAKSYKFHPEFLHPIHSVMERDGPLGPPDRAGRHDHHEQGGHAWPPGGTASGRSTTCGRSRTAWPTAWATTTWGRTCSRWSSI